MQKSTRPISRYYGYLNNQKPDSDVEGKCHDPSMLDHTFYLFARVTPSMVDV